MLYRWHVRELEADSTRKNGHDSSGIFLMKTRAMQHDSRAPALWPFVLFDRFG